jgi:hypothetical protein
MHVFLSGSAAVYTLSLKLSEAPVRSRRRSADGARHRHGEHSARARQPGERCKSVRIEDYEQRRCRQLTRVWIGVRMPSPATAPTPTPSREAISDNARRRCRAAPSPAAARQWRPGVCRPISHATSAAI